MRLFHTRHGVCKYWSPRGKRIAVPYTGSHKKVTTMRSPKTQGSFGRTIGSTRLPLSNLKAMQRHFGKAVAGPLRIAQNLSRNCCGKTRTSRYTFQKRPQCGRRVLEITRPSRPLRIMEIYPGHSLPLQFELMIAADIISIYYTNPVRDLNNTMYQKKITRLDDAA